MDIYPTNTPDIDQHLAREVHSLQPLLDNSIRARPEKLRDLLAKLEQEKEEDAVCLEETIFKLNFKSWVYRRMGEWDKACEINIQVGSIADQEHQIEADLFSKALNASLRWRLGKETQAEESLVEIKQLKSDPDFNRILARFNATLAYLYSRLAVPEYILKAVELLKEAIKVCPQKFYWKLRLGLEYRRLTNRDISVHLAKEIVTKENIAKYSALHIVNRGHSVLTEVTRSTDEPRIIGPAFVELAMLCRKAKTMLKDNDYKKIFGEEKVSIKTSSFLNSALEFDGSSAWVLSRYATFAKTENIDEAIEVLERCLRLREHTSTFAHLGKCYIRKADGSKETDQKNKYQEKACEFLKKAVDCSHSTNLPVMFELAMLCKSSRRIDEALELFNRIFNLQFEGHLFTVIQSCLQAALCYSAKGQYEPVVDKLTTAMYLSVTCHQLDDAIDELPKKFYDVLQEIEERSSSVIQDDRIKIIFQLAENFHKARSVAADIFGINNALQDGTTIIKTLIGYVEQKDQEKAMAGLNLLSTHPNISTLPFWNSNEMTKVRQRLLLATAESRLKETRPDHQLVFRQLFRLSHLRTPVDESPAAVGVTAASDILQLHDDNRGNSQTSSMSERLLLIFQDLFGLNVINNLQEQLTLGRVEDISLVVVVLDGVYRSGRFLSTLKTVAQLNSQKVLLVEAGGTTPDIPDFLRRFRQVRCPPLPTLGQSLDKELGAGPETRAGYSKQQVKDLMTLFCSLVNVDYPIQ